MAIRVAIVEDDQDIRAFLKEVVASDPELECVGIFPNAELFIAMGQKTGAEVVMMDINLPGQSGIACVGQLKPQMPGTQFLMCTIFEDADNIYDSLCAGATGYLLKNTTPERITAAIREIHAGGSPMSASIARKVVQSFQQPRPSKSQATESLSVREREILDCLSKGLRYKEIADKLFISTETVRTHIRNIYEKLQVNSRTEAMNKVYPRG